MSPRTPQQLEQIRKERRKAITDTALEVFAEHGYESASISKIAKKAGVSKGLMYNYFESKEDLLTSIMMEGMGEMLQMFDTDKDGILTREEFTCFIEDIFSLMSAKRSFYKLYFALIMQPSVWKLFESKLPGMIEPIIKTMVDYYRKKGVKDPVLEAALVGALLDGVGFHYVYKADLYPLEEMKKIIIERFV
ncbi:MAG: TetR/AcrR family transcriptional regulator [Bacteroidales bacterium]|nr:TetR/AcrR family transcriptional regulator [Bacteroidales bacterium]